MIRTCIYDCYVSDSKELCEDHRETTYSDALVKKETHWK